jgi:Short C-terminal domain
MQIHQWHLSVQPYLRERPLGTMEREWPAGEATVLNIQPAPDGKGSTLIARIRPRDGSDEFVTTIQCPPSDAEFLAPDAGDLFNVYFSRADHAAWIDTDDVRLQRSAQERRRRAREEEIARYTGTNARARPSDVHLRSKPGWPHVSKPGLGDDPLDMIARLAELHSQGELTDEEFAAAKKKLLAQS